VRSERAASWAAAAAAAVLLGITLYLLVHWLERGQLSDVGGYQQRAALMRAGQVPYRDFPFEYPPAALPVMLLPAYLPWSYATSFAVLMWLCGLGCIAAAAWALRNAGAGAARTWAALLAIGVAPLVLGSLFDTRFDLWPTLLAIGAVAAAARDRPVVSGGLLGLGFAAKLWPAVLLPLVAVHLWRRRGRDAAVTVVAAFLVVAGACFLPFAILAPSGLHAMFSDQLGRPLQVESLGAGVLMAAEHLGLRPLATIDSHGAQALSGRGAGLAADLSTLLEIGAVVAVWWLYAVRRRTDEEGLLLAAAAAVTALVAFDKVLSPQYLIWLVPFVFLVRGGSGVYVGGLLLLALGLTQTWFPWHYWSLALDHASPWSWYLLVRDLALVAIAVGLILQLSRGRRSAGRRAGSPAARPDGA
jgi:glycosyl transferase family 87